MLNAPRVRLTLGIFCFIRTPLFTGSPNQNQFFFPLLEPESVADALSKAIYSGYGGTIYMPGIMKVLATLVSHWCIRRTYGSCIAVLICFV